MRRIFYLILILNILISQHDSRFDTFDWVLYTQTGTINSITEGYNFTYFATSNAGILCLQLYQERFGEPITTAQGLSDNQILATHFDKSTGILWAASREFLDYSYNAEGNWFHINLVDAGLHRTALVQQIGSSQNYLWINAESAFLKLGKVSGVVMGILPLPDENDINWSGKHVYNLDLPEQLQNYTIMDGWMMNYNQFIDPYGKSIIPTTYYFCSNNKVYAGLEDGTIFSGDVQMETFYPLNNGLNNTDITAITTKNDFWVVGRNNFDSMGITRYNIHNNDFKHVDFENSINFKSQPFYSILETDKEVWIGGNSTISIYNKKKGFWREITEGNGVPGGKVTAMVEDESSIWVGSTRGLVNISKINKQAEQLDLGNQLLLQRINDLEIINGNLWIATDNYLLIYNYIINKLIDFKKLENTDVINNRKDIFFGFTDIYRDANNLYVATQVGILNYNIETEGWKVIVEPSSYSGSKVNKLVVVKEYCFLGTNDGIWQINIDNGYSQIYDFSFIGSVQDMYIRDDALFIGSDKGLIKYLWKKNL